MVYQNMGEIWTTVNRIRGWKITKKPPSFKTLKDFESHSRKKNPHNFKTQRIHVWYIYLHLVDLYFKCR